MKGFFYSNQSFLTIAGIVLFLVILYFIIKALPVKVAKKQQKEEKKEEKKQEPEKVDVKEDIEEKTQEEEKKDKKADKKPKIVQVYKRESRVKEDSGEKKKTLDPIYDRDVEWLKSSDLIVAEISIPSLGIGYELGLAESLGKKVICLYDINSDKTLSAMIGGNDSFEIVKYNSIDEVLEYLEKLK